MKHTILGVGCLLLMGLSWQVGAYDEDELKGLLKPKECQNCDLTGANLVMACLSGANLANADLTGANFKGARSFYTADTTGAIFCRTIVPYGPTDNSGC
jgi:hypothetical protein